MNTMHGAACFACSNRSRTRDAPTPTNISTKSEPEIEKNGTPASPATARASNVLPVPGGPYSSTPFGMRAPSAWNFFGFSRNSLISCSSSTASSTPATAHGLQGQPDQRCDDDQREKSAAEEAIQGRGLPGRVPASIVVSGFRPGELRPFWKLGRIEDAHVRQIAVPLREIEPVSDDETVGDLEAHVAHRNVDLTALRLRQERAD